MIAQALALDRPEIPIGGSLILKGHGGMRNPWRPHRVRNDQGAKKRASRGRAMIAALFFSFVGRFRRGYVSVTGFGLCGLLSDAGSARSDLFHPGKPDPAQWYRRPRPSSGSTTASTSRSAATEQSL